MKPLQFSPAHHSPLFGELVCSNSLKAEHLTNASGLLKAEMARLGSLVLSCAHKARVPAGGALAVDREVFSRLLTQAVEEHPLIQVCLLYTSSASPPPAGSIAGAALWSPPPRWPAAAPSS